MKKYLLMMISCIILFSACNNSKKATYEIIIKADFPTALYQSLSINSKLQGLIDTQSEAPVEVLLPALQEKFSTTFPDLLFYKVLYEELNDKPTVAFTSNEGALEWLKIFLIGKEKELVIETGKTLESLNCDFSFISESPLKLQINDINEDTLKAIFTNHSQLQLSMYRLAFDEKALVEFWNTYGIYIKKNQAPVKEAELSDEPTLDELMSSPNPEDTLPNSFISMYPEPEKFAFIGIFENEYKDSFLKMIQEKEFTTGFFADYIFVLEKVQQEIDKVFWKIYMLEKFNKSPINSKDILVSKYDIDKIGRHIVNLTWTNEGAVKYTQETKKALRMYLVMILDNEVANAPIVENVITGNEIYFSGNKSEEETKLLAKKLAPPIIRNVPFKIVSLNTIEK